MVQRRHSEKYPEFDRSTTSLRKRYQKALKEVGPTGNPECPAYVRLAKKCDRDIFQKAEMQIGDDSEESVMEMPTINLKDDIGQEKDEPFLGQSQESSSPHSRNSSKTDALIDQVLRRSPRIKRITPSPIHTPSPIKQNTKRKRVTINTDKIQKTKTNGKSVCASLENYDKTKPPVPLSVDYSQITKKGV